MKATEYYTSKTRLYYQGLAYVGAIPALVIFEIISPKIFEQNQTIITIAWLFSIFLTFIYIRHRVIFPRLVITDTHVIFEGKSVPINKIRSAKKLVSKVILIYEGETSLKEEAVGFSWATSADRVRILEELENLPYKEK